jgi:hypothetical protein
MHTSRYNQTRIFIFGITESIMKFIVDTRYLIFVVFFWISKIIFDGFEDKMHAATFCFRVLDV